MTQPTALIGESVAAHHLRSEIATVARTDAKILITGESGVGKEITARLIHAESARRDRPFVAINCAGVPETLLETELFGHVRGSFTGAYRDKAGLMELADGGTLLLDEVGEVSSGMQVKLLRALQEREIRRVGENKSRRVDVRIVAATNRDLAHGVAGGNFRQDLYYRLKVVELHVPALRERRDDVLPLARVLLADAALRMKRKISGLAPGAADQLLRYEWPGNVRELENAMERAVALERTPMILPDSLPEQIRDLAAELPTTTAAPAEAFPDAGFDLERHVQDIEREYIAEALRRAGGVKVKAAELLGMSFRSFRYYTKKYNLK
jgi:transcriptional regulator with GAF, ATPase, and Fis domain